MATRQTAERALEEAEWGTGVLKGNEVTVDYDVDDLRDALYGRLTEALVVLHHVTVAGQPWSAPTEQLLRLSTRACKDMVALTKVFLAHKHVPGEAFAALVKVRSRGIWRVAASRVIDAPV